MAALRDESVLYRKLDDMYEANKEDDISEAFFSSCISVAKTFSKREIQFVLFKLGLLHEEANTGIEAVTSLLNSLQKVLDSLTGRDLKRKFFITVLKTALEEMS